MVYLKVLGYDDAKSIHPATGVHYGTSEVLAFTHPPDGGGGTGSIDLRQVLAVYVMSEQGKTLDKIRGLTKDEGHAEWSKEVEPDGKIPKSDQIPPTTTTLR